jgi:hypothetical protein
MHAGHAVAKDYRQCIPFCLAQERCTHYTFKDGRCFLKHNPTAQETQRVKTLAVSGACPRVVSIRYGARF